MFYLIMAVITSIGVAVKYYDYRKMQQRRKEVLEEFGERLYKKAEKNGYFNWY